MNLRTKSILLLAASCISLGTALYFACESVVMNGFESLEQRQTLKNLATVRDSFMAQLADMDKTAADWGHWDDTFRFVNDRNKSYRESNLAPAQLGTIQLDTILIIDSRKMVVASVSTEPSAGRGGTIPAVTLQSIKSAPALLSHRSLSSAVRGIIPSSKGIFLVASRPITKSSNQGAIRGAMVMGRHLKNAEIQLLAGRTHCKLEAFPFDSRSLPMGFQIAKRAFEFGGTTSIRTPDAKQIEAYTVLRDLKGKPCLILRATYPRAIYWEGLASVRVLLIALALSGCAMLILAIFLLDRFVLRRVAKLNTEVAGIGLSGDVRERVRDDGHDEISSLGGSINQMLDVVRCSHEKVIESEGSLRSANAELESQKSSLEQQNDQLAQMHTELEARNEQLTANEAMLKTTVAEAERARLLQSAASKRFQELFEKLPVPCFTLDEDGVVKEFNRATEALWGLPTQQIYDHHIDSIVTSVSSPMTMLELTAHAFEGHSIESMEGKYERADGSALWLLSSVFPLQDPDGKVVGVLNACIDITEAMHQREMIENQLLQISESNVEHESNQLALAELNKKLEALATTDGLTDLHNHRAFQDHLERQFQLARRSGKNLALLLMDVDHFKQFNDSYGHIEGDQVLIKVAHILRDTARGSDFVARYGGEEFVVLLTDSDAVGAMDAAERYRLAIEQAHWPHRQITVSIGVANLDAGTFTRTDLITRADRALYDSKRDGRNRVTQAGPSSAVAA